MTDTDTANARLRRLARRRLRFEVLERHHEQARVCLDAALREGDEDGYRIAQRTEDAYRYERVRRKLERETPDVGVRIDGWR